MPRLLESSTFRLALLYLALFGTSILALMAFIYWSTAVFMAGQIDATIAAEIEGLGERYRSRGLRGLTQVIHERVARDPGRSSVYLVTDPNMRPIVGNLTRWPEAPEEGGWMEFEMSVPGPEGESLHHARARHFELQGDFHLLVGRDTQDLLEARSRIVETLAWGLAMTAVLGLAGAAVMSRRIVSRIESINQTSREIMGGDLARRIPVRGSGDDFDQLTSNLNSMLDQIERLMAGVRHVSDNIAHDLKTPLARLRSRLELAMAERDESARTPLVAKAIEEADGLLGTFNALLRIARIEAGQGKARFTDVDLNALLRDVADLYEPICEERGIVLGMQAEPRAVVSGDRDLLFQALSNLVDNAAKYAPSGGEVAIVLTTAGDCVTVTVADSGSGIPAEARERVFERFYRLESSRSTPGNGLGLSLVAAVATLHGAQVSLDDNGPGLRASLRLPRAGDAGPRG